MSVQLRYLTAAHPICEQIQVQTCLYCSWRHQPLQRWMPAIETSSQACTVQANERLLDKASCIRIWCVSVGVHVRIYTRVCLCVPTYLLTNDVTAGRAFDPVADAEAAHRNTSVSHDRWDGQQFTHLSNPSLTIVLHLLQNQNR